MNIETKGIYHWKLGDVAMARVSQKTYARVRVVKDEKGLFYDDKVLGISGNEDGSITVTKELCYYVETCRTNHKFWLPYTSLHLAERSRPFYGTEKVTNKDVKTEVSPNKTPAMPRKRNTKEDHIVPLGIKVNQENSDLNTFYDNQHIPKKQCRYENAFKEYVRRGKDIIFDQYFEILKRNPEENKDSLSYLLNTSSCTQDRFEFVTKSIATVKEIDNYFHHSWKYNFLAKQTSVSDSGNESTDDLESTPTKVAPSVHTPWCLVCGKEEMVLDCVNCPAAYHPPCRRKWLLTVIHRKNPPKKEVTRETLIDKILSSTRTKGAVLKDEENFDFCPSCIWGPKVGYDDIVWNKLGTCSWWPARILSPGEVPPCLLAKFHTSRQWPLRYYGTRNHSWGSPDRTCLFLPSHTGALDARETDLKQAVMDANDDYITVYLT